MAIEEFAVHFIEDRALFGAYPTQERIRQLEDMGVNLIVDLTVPGEKKCVQYVTDIEIIKFPIQDGKAPMNKIEFCKLVLEISDKIDQGYYVFIHCRAGHGRSGLFVACLMAYRMRINPKEAIEIMTEYHAQRTNLKPYNRRKAPLWWDQKQFVYTIGRFHVIGPNSIFYKIGPTNCEVERYFESFLLQTYLGPIIGENGPELETRRKQLIVEGF